MKMSGGVEWALHCCVVLTAADRPVPALRLAQLHDVSASYLAKQLQALSRAGLVRAAQGQAGGYVLTRDPSEITVLDVVQAVDGARSAFVCTEIRQRGPLATPPRGLFGPLCHRPDHVRRGPRLARRPARRHDRRPRDDGQCRLRPGRHVGHRRMAPARAVIGGGARCAPTVESSTHRSRRPVLCRCRSLTGTKRRVWV